ncbi:LysR family transcriptional regulator [Vibrio lamellibrachiae]|uniref:LysR family transcriptional regulator n=1 Tax=Vibrio lamellibrachiae TaxID=2910253 RepID=UPI003D0ED4CF
MNKDFNLLQLLLVLSEEKQTISAARRLHVSQPTISVMLRKLREQFNDPLFVRDKNQLEPTARCKQLLEQLPSVLDSLEALYIDEKSWDISQLRGEVSLIFSPPLMPTIATQLVLKLTQLAPNVTVECYHWGFDALRDLELKSQCWGFSYLPMETNKNLTQMDIGNDEFVVVARHDLPLASFSLTDLLQFPLCINLIHGETEASRSEKLIKKLNLSKHINVRTSDINVMLNLVEHGNYIGVVSKHAVANLPAHFQSLALPEELTKEAQFRPVSLFTHQRNRMDPLTHWLYQESKIIIS